jgi:DNA-directed RNA polymerase specialized sigma24 family protein
MAAVAELEPLERDLLFLIAWEGCSSSLAAIATGVPQSEVRPRLNTIRKEIRRRMSARSSQNPDPFRDVVTEAGAPTDEATS